MVVSVKIFERFEGYGLNYARPIAVLLILVCLIIFFVLRILIKKKRVR
jgi:molybdate/tungstate transport system permease protein